MDFRERIIRRNNDYIGCHAEGSICAGVASSGHGNRRAPGLRRAAQLYVRGRSGVFPGLRGLAGGLHERLSARWPEAVITDYPALARPGSAQVQVPDFWQPEV